MNESIIPISPALLALLSTDNALPKPFTQEIFLLEIVIAGTSYCKEIDEVESLIVPEKVLTMKREPQNEHDESAIAIYCDKIKVGYVPAEMNLVCSRLMDAGKLFFCRVVDKKWKHNWLRINANIYMVE